MYSILSLAVCLGKTIGSVIWAQKDSQNLKQLMPVYLFEFKGLVPDFFRPIITGYALTLKNGDKYFLNNYNNDYLK